MSEKQLAQVSVEETEGEEEEEEEEEEESEHPSALPNFGFTPIPEVTKERREDPPRPSPAHEAKRQQINRLLCRYPQLKLRSSETTLKQLVQYDESELENILTNAQNDLAAIRGAPMADFIIGGVAGLVDTFLLPGYLARCLADHELKNDVEAEATLLFGACGNRTNILFRALNHGYTQICSPSLPIEKSVAPNTRAPDYFEPVAGP